MDPEERARQEIDRLLDRAGWKVQDPAKVNLSAGLGVAIREFPLRKGHGLADYLLYVDSKAAGVVEAKPEGATLTGVEPQAAKYSEGLPDGLPAHWRPLPLCYQSTGIETRFTNGHDPEPRSRQVLAFHRPDTLRDWVSRPVPPPSPTTGAPDLPMAGGTATSLRPATLRSKLCQMPPLVTAGLWPPQIRAVQNLERSLADDRPRALIQMATGSGKTFTAVTAIYRLIKHAGARRVLFLVDRTNLAKQAENEFHQYVTPDDGRKFSELYNMQRMQGNRLDPVAKVCITTIQRLYSMLKGDDKLDPEPEEG